MTPLPPRPGGASYGTATLADVLPGAAAALGVPIARDGRPADPLGLTDALGGARRVVVLLVDGLGADLVRAHADLAPTLAHLARPVGDLSAPCPSTTPVSLATLGTGLPPGSHGILGFVTDVPGEDRTLNHVQWADDPDPDVWQAQRTVFEQAQAAGVAATAVGPYAYAGSGLTRAVYRGATTPAPSATATSAHWCWARWPPPRAPWSTATSPNSTSPATSAASTQPAGGPSSRSSTALVEQLVTGLPDDAALLVTADHGMLDVPEDTRLDLDADPDLSDGVRVLAGEPRARYVHAEPGAADDVLARWRRCSATGPGSRAGRRPSRAASSARWTTPCPPASATSSPSPGAAGRSSPRARARTEPADRVPRLAHRDGARDPAAARPRPRTGLTQRDVPGPRVRGVRRAAGEPVGDG